LFGCIDIETLKVEDSGPKTKKRKFSSEENDSFNQIKQLKPNEQIPQTRSKAGICYKKQNN